MGDNTNVFVLFGWLGVGFLFIQCIIEERFWNYLPNSIKSLKMHINTQAFCACSNCIHICVTDEHIQSLQEEFRGLMNACCYPSFTLHCKFCQKPEKDRRSGTHSFVMQII